MQETIITHGVDERLYSKLEQLAKEAGMTPDEYAARIVREEIIERTKPKGAGKIRHFRRD
ncbi:hypothetical protein [Pseudomonas knackmussii]|uniref:hypothetical protein n=1 Tax=Pseudomonas knackmussii TaxID=65741 RepID=UPI001362A398|nr:hypothetical protein [Pseudomonas knackmussii]